MKGIKAWIDYRLPIFATFKKFGEHRTPKNLSHAWSLGSLSCLALFIQIFTGIFLAMHYVPHVEHAFDSVDHIMRNVNYGWLFRYMHANGASFFFIVVYLHILRGIYYGSFKRPRELLWMIGVVIFLIMTATAFMGYVLPWGQMSYWGATVITNLFSVVPFIGDDIIDILLGGSYVNNASLNRFFVLHYLFPFLIVLLIFVHIVSLWRFGSNNPEGIEVQSDRDTVTFHPYYTIKDCEAFGFFLIALFMFVMFIPNILGHPDNYIEADPLVTPAHIVPEWYFLPFYAILRSIPDKLLGVLTMFGAIFVWFLLPFLDKHKVRSGRYRPIFRVFFCFFVVDFLFLIWIGGQVPEEPYITMGRIATLFYFAFFVVILPLLSRYEKCRHVPSSISVS